MVMSDNPNTRTPWAKSLMPTARPRGITERGALFWDSAAWAPGTSATVITTAAASRSRVRKEPYRHARPMAFVGVLQEITSLFLKT